MLSSWFWCGFLPGPADRSQDECGNGAKGSRFVRACTAQKQCFAAERRRPQHVTRPSVPPRRRTDLLEWSRDWITLEDLDERIAEALMSPVPLWPGEWGEKRVGAEAEEDRYPDDPVDLDALDDMELEPADDDEDDEDDGEGDNGDWEDGSGEEGEGQNGDRWSAKEARESDAAGPLPAVLQRRTRRRPRPPAAPGRRIVPPEDS